MSEIKLYINANVHTGEIREAAALLNHNSLKIITNRIGDIRYLENSQTNQDAEMALSIRILKPDNIPPELIRRWKRGESWVFKLLRLAQHFTYPDKIDQNLVKMLEPRSIPKRPLDALVFFGTIRDRLEYLVSEQAQSTHTTITLAGATLIESRILHQALYGRRYLVKVA